MLSPDEEAQKTEVMRWLAGNQAAQGSPEWVQMANAYRALRQREMTHQPPPPPPPSSGLENIGAGMIEGNPFVAIPDLAMQGGTWLGKQAGLVSEDTQAPQLGPWLSEQAGLDPDRSGPGYLVGNIFGGGVGGGARRIGTELVERGLPEAAKLTARILGQETAATAGGLAGAQVGESLGGDVGAVAGGLAGGMAPSAMAAGGSLAARGVFGRSDGLSGDIYDAAVRNEVPASVGMVGNRGARYLENSFGLFPVLNSQVIRRQENQVDRVGDILRDTARGFRQNNVGPGPQPPAIMAGNRAEPTQMRSVPHNPAAWNQPAVGTVGVGVDELGQQARDIAQSHLDQTKDTITRQNTALEQTIGARTAVPVQPTIERLEKMRPYQASGTQDIIRRDTGNLEQIRGEHQSPVDVQLDTRLRQERNRLMSQRQAEESRPVLRDQWGGTTGPDQDKIRRLTAEIDAKNQEIRGNWGVPYEQMRRQRTEVGEPLQGGMKGMDAGVKKQAYAPMTAALQKTADDAGIGPEFRQWMGQEEQWYARKGSLSEGGDLAQSQQLVDKKTNADIFNWAMGTKHKAVEKFDFLERAAGGANSPRWRQFVGDFYERLGRANPSEQNALGTKFSPDVFLRNWDDLDQGLKTKLAQVDPDLVRRIDDTLLLSQALKERGKASNPSGTAAMAIPGILGGMVGSGQVANAGIMTAGTQGMISLWLSDAFSKAVAGRTLPLSERFMSQLEQMGGRAAGLGVNQTRDDE